MKHKIETHQNQLLKCDQCDYSFFLQSDLKDHKTSAHPNITKEEKVAVENPIGQIVKNVQKSWKKLKFQCENCDCSYDESYNLQLHKKQVNAKQLGIQFKCQVCLQFKSCTQIGLKSHKLNCQTNGTTPKNSQPSINQNSQQPMKRAKILPPNNSNPSSSETIPPPTKKLRTSVPEENATPQSNKKLKTLNPQNDDDDNEKIANHEVPKVTFKCDRCSILFDSVEEKERHMKLGLGKLKQFQCPKCEFRACHYNGAKEHFAKIHLKRPINTNPPQEKPE